MTSAVILLSGGLDSATAAAWAKAKGWTCHALTVAYGQRHKIELSCAKAQARLLGMASYRVLRAPLGQLGGSALTDDTLAVPEGPPTTGGIPITYVPARNLNFLALAAALAEVVGATDLVIGANAVDFSGYPDCRRPFFDALERTLDAGTKLGVEGGGWKIHTPLIDMAKADIIRLGLSLKVDYAQTSSCYNPNTVGQPCGLCESCHIRAAGFRAAGLDDPRIIQARKSSQIE